MSNRHFGMESLAEIRHRNESGGPKARPDTYYFAALRDGDWETWQERWPSHE